MAVGAFRKVAGAISLAAVLSASPAATSGDWVFHSAAEGATAQSAAEVEAEKTAKKIRHLRKEGARVFDSGWVRPVDPARGRFTSGFGYRSLPGLGAWNHNGVDLAGAVGTPIRAAHDGKVIHAGIGYAPLGLTGYVVVLDHGKGITTAYGHMHANGVRVKVGDSVKAGDHIADIGNAGRSTGAHLHHTVAKDGVAIDPELFYAEKGLDIK